MNWCKPHWDYLREVIVAKGLDRFVGDGATDGIKGLTGDRFDPLMGSWTRINTQMLRSPALNGRMFACPLCILVADGQPETVKNWVDGCTTEALEFAINDGLMERPTEPIVVPDPPEPAGKAGKVG